MRAGNDYERAKRELHRRIGRNRRRIDGRIHGFHRRGLQWMFWGRCAYWAWRQFQGIWADSAADRRPDQPGDDHGRTA